MTRIAFIGLGNMGGGMAARQVVGGREVRAFDLSEAAVKKVVAAGAFEAGSIARAVEQADAVIIALHCLVQRDMCGRSMTNTFFRTRRSQRC